MYNIYGIKNIVVLLHIKETSENACFYFMNKTSENAHFYFMSGFLWSSYSDTIFCDLVRKKLLAINIYLS